MEINNKLIMFVLSTILFIFTLTFPNTDHLLLIIMYVIFIIIGLYDLGKDEVDEAGPKS
jgi:hypothetical protein